MKQITAADLAAHRANGPWRDLEGFALLTNVAAEKAANIPFKPVLGGGTRLMLAMEHRISDDIDLFILDPQWLGYLTPRLNDAIEDVVNDYDEGTTSLKLFFDQGEIDYIVSAPLLGLPNEACDDCVFDLEPVAEVLAKKLFYRGDRLSPRDLFDWRLIDQRMPSENMHEDIMIPLLAPKLQGIQAALHALSTIPPDSPRWAEIRTPYPLELQESVAWAQERVTRWMALTPQEPAPEAPAPAKTAPDTDFPTP